MISKQMIIKDNGNNNDIDKISDENSDNNINNCNNDKVNNKY